MGEAIERPALEAGEALFGGLLALLLIGVILAFWYGLQYQEPTGPAADLQKIVKEMKEVIKHPMQTGESLTFPVALISTTPYSIVVYPKNHRLLPDRCRSRTCICVYEQLAGEKRKETCKQYSKIRGHYADARCGRALYTEELKTFPMNEPSVLNIRRECNKISFSI